ncbi:hypothetical protein M0657_008688 [Pyricularia oryzae]|nr:hypothetical protein M0657_008688 [Pyricularia oryzae]KAI7920674.1 hypothetical protein M9X92_005759 [Pyricularia oryzae]
MPSVALGQTDVLEEYLYGLIQKNVFLSSIETVKIYGFTYTTGFTALHKAAGDATPSIITLILKYRADPNAEPTNGCTALMEAALWGRAICALVVKDKIYRGNTCMRDTDGAMIVGILSPNKNEPGVRGQS